VAIVLVGAATLFESDAVTAAVVPKPSGVVVGDLLVATVTHSDSAGIATPSGWSVAIARGSSSAIFTAKWYRFATSTDVVAGSYTFQTSTTAGRVTGAMYALRGVDPTSPLDSTPVSVGVNSTTGPLVPGVDTVTSQAFIDSTATLNASASETLTAPSNFTALSQNVAGTGRRQAIAYRFDETPGTSSTVQWTKTTTTSLQHIGSQTAFRPDANAPVTPTVPIRVVGNEGRIRTQTANATSVRIKVATDAAMTQNVVYTTPQTPTAQGNTYHQVTGLTPSLTKYYYRVMMTGSDGEIQDTESVQGRLPILPTSGQLSFTLSFSACCDAVDSAAMTAIYNRNDPIFVNNGDFYYAKPEPGEISTTSYRTKFNGKMSKLVAPNHAAVMATSIVDVGPSDHDFGMNNNLNNGTTPTATPLYNAVYREVFPVGSVGNGTTGVYRTYTVGRVRFIRIDCRSFASAPSATDNTSKTMLGSVQKQWLKNTITAATEPLIVIHGDTSWIGSADAGDDGWLGYTVERAELGAFFASSGKNIGMTGGDMHALAAHAGGSGSPGGIPYWGAAPIHNESSIKGGPYTNGPYPSTVIVDPPGVEQYARLAFTDSGSNITVAYTGYSADNTVRLTQTNTFSADAPVTPPPSGTVVLNENRQAGDLDFHLTVDHPALRTAYLARNPGTTLPVVTDPFDAVHKAVHATLHSEHNALGAGTTLPTTIGASGHLAHHAALAKAHNLRLVGGGVPSIPTSVTRVSNASDTATITWAPPTSAGGSPITGYRVSRDGTSVNGTGPYTIVRPSTDRSFTFGSMQTGVAYNLTVTAINPYGDGPASTGSVTILSEATGGMPTNDLADFTLLFNDDFNVDASAGQFLSKYPGWRAYPNSYKDTSDHGTYEPNIITCANSTLDMWIHYESSTGRYLCAAPEPRINGINGPRGQTYGRYAFRWRVVAPIPGYKTAWLLWPDSNNSDEGEIDFPEGDLDGVDTIRAYSHDVQGVHSHNAFSKNTGVVYAGSGWHTGVIEWKPTGVTFWLDGTNLGTTPSLGTPVTPMHWVLQTETELGSSSPPPQSSSGHVQLDWVAVWDYTPGSTP